METKKQRQWEKLKKLREKTREKLGKIGNGIKMVLHKHFPKRIWSKPKENQKGQKF